MSFFENDFEKRWEELFKNVNVLNEYTAREPVKLRNVKIKNHDIDGAIFSGAEFVGVEWIATRGQGATFTKTIFEKCKFTQSNFSGSRLTDVVFRECEFTDTDINKAILTNVHFENCKFDQMGLVENTGDTLKFEHSEFLNSGLGDSAIDFEFSECILDGVDLSVTKGGRKMLIEDGLLSDVDFGDSRFSDVVLRRVKDNGGEGLRFDEALAESITVENSTLSEGVVFADTQAKLIRIINSELGYAGFDGGGVQKVAIRESQLGLFDVSEGFMPHIEIAKSQVHQSFLFNGGIGEFLITDSELGNTKGKNFKADTVIWDNVTLDGKIDLTNAQVKDFRPTRLKRGPKLQLITTGSNMKF